MSAVTVVTPGLLTTVQDLGPLGLPGRAACRWPARWIPCRTALANALVGNDRDAATLEVTLLGPELEFEDERLVAVAGAEFELTLDGRPVPSHAPFTVAAGLAPALRRAAARRARVPRRRRRHRRAAGARQPRDASGQRAWAASTAARSSPAIGCRSAIASRRAGRRRSRRRTRSSPLPDRHARAPRPARPAGRPLRAGRARRAAVGAVRRSAQNSDRMGFRLDGSARSTHARGADIISDATPLGVAAGARVGPADSADGRSPDDRRLSEDRDGDRRRHRRSPASSRPATRSRSASARRARRWRR